MYRWLKRHLQECLVAVNIAGFEAFAGKPGKFDLKMPVIVGKKYHKTPDFSKTIKYVVIYPYWKFTPSIARNETLPKLKKDFHYLAKHNMRVFQGWEPDAPELDATTIDWSKVSKKSMNRYRIHQAQTTCVGRDHEIIKLEEWWIGIRHPQNLSCYIASANLQEHRSEGTIHL